jgi:hypothetical protein
LQLVGFLGMELLGHTSILMDFCLTHKDEFIASVDRDEKVAFSRTKKINNLNF